MEEARKNRCKPPPLAPKTDNIKGYEARDGFERATNQVKSLTVTANGGLSFLKQHSQDMSYCEGMCLIKLFINEFIK